MIARARVLAHGMACPVGLFTAAALAAMVAGIKRVSESELVLDRAGDPARAAMLESRLAPRTPRSERALYLARFALEHAVAPLAGSGVGALPCFLALPAPNVGPPLDLVLVQRRLVEVARTATGGVVLEMRPNWLFARGRAAAFLALHAAVGALARGEHTVVLVGGLDSQVDPLTLRALADANRLLGRRNPDGLIPGEGAAFILLASMRAASASQSLGSVVGSAIAHEPHPLGNDEPTTALGLTSVFRELRQQRAERVDAVISAQSGESRYERAFAYAYLRNATLMPEPLRMTTMGAELGDAGAAAGAMALVAAIAGLRPSPSRPWAAPQHGSALVYGESDDGCVGACLVEP